MTLFFIILFGTVQIALLLVIYHKLSLAIQIVRHESTRHANNAISQIEGLLAVYAEMHSQRGLPKSRGWAASPDFLALLISSVQERRPLTVLECSSGLSTVVLAACMRNAGHGKVFSLEHDKVYADKTCRLLEIHGLTDWATIIDAPLIAVSTNGWEGKWYDTSGMSPVLSADLLVIDGPPNVLGPLARYPALPLLHRYLSKSAVVFLDDAARDSEAKAVQRWLAEFPDLKAVEGIECEKGCAVLQRCEPD